MVTAAFKSNSRRGSAGGGDSPQKNRNPPPQQRLRRSMSVDVLSRPTTTTASEFGISSEFLNKRDNPLYWAAGGSPPGDDAVEIPTTPAVLSGAGALESKTTKSSNGLLGQRGRSATTTRNSDSKLSNVVAGQRGRSVVRNSDSECLKKEKIIGRSRSFSRVNDNGGRGRSVSRGRYAFGASESEAEQESVVSNIYRVGSNSIRASSNTGKPTVSGGEASDVQNRNMSFHPSLHPSVGSALDSQVRNWEDGISTSSLSEAEEKTIKAVYEQMKIQGEKSRDNTASNEIYETVRSEVRRAISDMQSDLENAIRRSNSSVIPSTDVTDIPPELVKPGAIELVSDIRREYARKFEESHERARKLRSDLAVEEQRRQELGRILKETLPDPKTSAAHRSRLGRKSSSERKKMSKRLTDEALSYFDECVSISTFDSSDFSATEDSVLSSVDTTLTAVASTSLPQDRPCISASSGPNSHLYHKQVMRPKSSPRVNGSCHEVVIDQDSESLDNTDLDKKFGFSFSQKPTESMQLQQDIKEYIKIFEKSADKDGTTSEKLRTTYCKTDGYDLLDGRESLLFDKVAFRNRIESGSLHLCGGLAFPFLPFAHLV